jgi:serine/threonine protein kinase
MVPGAPLSGAPRYQILRLLGEGGMGQALLARDRSSDVDVCIKRLHAGVEVGALRQELDALRRLDHPGIVRLLDAFVDGGQDHLVMEYVGGDGLDRYLAARGPLPEPAALDLAHQMLDAVVYAHGRGVVHRDLKPWNVLLAWRGERVLARVLDFGIALVDDVDAHGNITGEGNVIGSPVYMAPEQVRGEIIGPAADVYAVGLLRDPSGSPFRSPHFSINFTSKKPPGRAPP